MPYHCKNKDFSIQPPYAKVIFTHFGLRVKGKSNGAKKIYDKPYRSQGNDKLLTVALLFICVTIAELIVYLFCASQRRYYCSSVLLLLIGGGRHGLIFSPTVKTV